MTPGARIAAAIGIMDQVLDGAPAERVLTTWARRNRYAGSGDRAAIRDHVYDALRRLRSCAALGGAMTGRGVMIGLLRAQGMDPHDFFTGGGYAPPGLTDTELAPGSLDDPYTALDCPDWLAPELRTSLGNDFTAVMQVLQTRAPVFLRVNIARTTLDAAQAALAAELISTRPVALSDTALEVIENPRKIQNSAPYRQGDVELQDAASQAICDALPRAARILDFCAGGGGKSLALAARDPDAKLYAHDINPVRMADLAVRASRAGASITPLDSADLPGAGDFDLVLVDAPCSGSGAWRRAPHGKWDLTPLRLDELLAVQNDILRQASSLVAANGTLAYVTCSLLASENAQQVQRFLADSPGWTATTQQTLTPLDGGDGFFLAIFDRI